jgi:hypothetical protein
MKPEVLEFINANPFQVIDCTMDGNRFLFLRGDEPLEPESWIGRSIMACAIGKMDYEERREDLRENYCRSTRTDGSKVNWVPIEHADSPGN